MAVEIEFVDAPPPDNRRGGNDHRQELRAFAEALKERPGQWAVWPFPTTSPYNTSNNIRRGTVAPFPFGEFEAVTRKKKVYVRAVPPKEDQ